MSRTDAETIAHRLADDPLRTLAALGLDEGARREGGGYKILCPSHAERRPSCSVTAPDGTLRIKCFSCDFSGDVYGLIAKVRGGLDTARDFPAILSVAAAIAGEDLDADRPRRKVIRRNTPPIIDDAYNDLARVLLDWFPVRRDLEVSAYLKRRGILDAVKHRWGALPSDRRALDDLRAELIRRFGPETWERSGLAHVHRGPEDARPCRPDCSFAWSFTAWRILIPWRVGGCNGVVTALQRRIVGDPLPGKPKYLFPAGRRPLAPYGAETFMETGPHALVVFTEGAADTEAYHTIDPEAGVLGLPGASGWRAEWAIYGKGAEVLIATDADEAGDRVAEKMAGDLEAAGARLVRRVRPSTGKDWNEVLLREVA